MAKQRNGINDAFRGSVGTVIGYEWRGQWCMRARPRYVHNPRTAAQQDNRQLFKRVVELTSQLRGVLRMGMRAQSLAMHITEANLFTKSNKGLFRLDAEGCLETEWAQVLVADGPVVPVAEPAVETRHAASPENAVADMEARHAASLQWGNTVTVALRACGEGMCACADDEVYVAAFCPARGEVARSGSVWRKKERVVLTLPGGWQGLEVHLWVFAMDYQGAPRGRCMREG